MKYLPLLALAALAAFAPDVYASNPQEKPKPKEEPNSQPTGLFGRLRAGITGAIKPKKDTGVATAAKPKEGLNSVLPPDVYKEISKDFTPNQHSTYAVVNHAANQNVEQFRSENFYFRILRAFQQLGLTKPKPEIIDALLAARAPGTKLYIPLGRFISKSGAMSPVNSLLLQKLARAALPLATGDENAIVVSDAFSLFQLARAAGSSDTITALLKQNAKRFNNGLGIDITWTKNGFLDWFLAAIDPEAPQSALRDVLSIIKFTRTDLSKIWCNVIYLYLGQEAQTHGSPLTSDRYAEILNQIFLKTRKIWANYDKYKITSVQNALKPIALAKNPVAFDFKQELDTCFTESPSIFALAAGLVSLLDENSDHELSKFKIAPTVQLATRIDMDIEDMWWLMFSTWQLPISAREDILKSALTNMSYTQSHGWLIRELFQLKRYKDMANVIIVIKPIKSKAFKTEQFEQMLIMLKDVKNGAMMDNGNHAIFAKMLA